MDELTDEQKAMLAFEAGRWKYFGLKEATIRDRFGITMTTYAQRVNHIIDLPAAEALEPMLVRRLRRLREVRRAARTAG